MYKIEPTTYGFKVTSTGSFTLDEVERLRIDLLRTLSAYNRPFSLLLDARKMVPPPPEVRDAFVTLHASIWQLSCERVAFIVESPVAKGQVRQMHYSASPNSQDRIFDSSKFPDWEARALAWVTDGVEPDEMSNTEKLAIQKF
jgi:hypothetical protein